MLKMLLRAASVTASALGRARAPQRAFALLAARRMAAGFALKQSALTTRFGPEATRITGVSVRSLFIKVDSTPNPDSMKFIPEKREVLPEKYGNGVHFGSMAEAKGCRLARRLLKITEITGVFLGRDFISVNKAEDASWAALKPIILDAMMDAFAEAESKGTAIVEDIAPAQDTVITDEDDEVVAMIKELLETRVRPAVQEDGGDIHYVGFDPDTGIVRVRMAGSCVGCPSSTATLRNGVENMLMHYIPEVKGIEQVKADYEKEGEKELRTLEERLASAGAS